MKQRKGRKKSCDVGKATEGLENELYLRTTHSPMLHLCHSSFSNPSFASPMSQDFHLRHLASRACTLLALLILQAFCRFTYITAHSPTLPLLYLCHSSFSNPYVVLPMSQLILQPLFCFSYVTGFSLMSPGEPPMHIIINPLKWDHLQTV